MALGIGGAGEPVSARPPARTECLEQSSGLRSLAAIRGARRRPLTAQGGEMGQEGRSIPLGMKRVASVAEQGGHTL